MDRCQCGLLLFSGGGRVGCLAVPVEPAEGQASDGAWPASPAAFFSVGLGQDGGTQGRVWAAPIIKSEPSGNQPLGCEAVRECVQVADSCRSIALQGRRRTKGRRRREQSGGCAAWSPTTISVAKWFPTRRNSGVTVMG